MESKGLDDKVLSIPQTMMLASDYRLGIPECRVEGDCQSQGTEAQRGAGTGARSRSQWWRTE